MPELELDGPGGTIDELELDGPGGTSLEEDISSDDESSLVVGPNEEPPVESVVIPDGLGITLEDFFFGVGIKLHPLTRSETKATPLKINDLFIFTIIELL